jgi:hypothetical protein
MEELILLTFKVTAARSMEHAMKMLMSEERWD